MTFLEALRAKLFDLKNLVQYKNVWELNNNRICAAVFDHNIPSAEDIQRMADAREHCHRLIVIAPASSPNDQLLWVHSELVDAFITHDEGVDRILEGIEPALIITGKDAEEGLPDQFKSKLHQYA